MSDANRADQIDIASEQACGGNTPIVTDNGGTIRAAERWHPSELRTRAFTAKGRIAAEQLKASDGIYVIEVLVGTRLEGGGPHKAEFSDLLDEQVKRQLHAIADRFPDTARR
jgi:hypothetical protein